VKLAERPTDENKSGSIHHDRGGEGLENYRVGTWAIAALLFDFLAPDWLHRSCAVFRCVLIGCTDVVLCCDVGLLSGCIGSEGPFLA
jgi:hypothetical protein